MSPGFECAERFSERRLFAVSTKGTQRYDQVAYLDNDVFVFGPETRGLPADILLDFRSFGVSGRLWSRAAVASIFEYGRYYLV